jgi:hypothetical protein
MARCIVFCVRGVVVVAAEVMGYFFLKIASAALRGGK